jgi:hypothetical protein
MTCANNPPVPFIPVGSIVLRGRGWKFVGMMRSSKCFFDVDLRGQFWNRILDDLKEWLAFYQYLNTRRDLEEAA